MKLPNFIIAGFPKCGSTSLHYYLNAHPEIFMPKQKELHYFSYSILSSMVQGPQDKEVNRFHISSFKDYKACYHDIKNEKAVGEVSPSYINYKSCIKEIKDKLGTDVKIIVLLRDPVKRTYSNYLHLVREHREDLDFYSALMEEPHRKDAKYSDFWYYTFNSFYYDKIKAYQDAFSEVLLISTEELSNNTEETVKKVYKFLEVDDSFLAENIERRYNEGGVYADNLITRVIFRQSKLRSLIKASIPITPWMKHAKHNLISRFKEKTPEMDINAENYLVKLFQDDVDKVSSELGVDISLWNKKFSRNNNE